MFGIARDITTLYENKTSRAFSLSRCTYWITKSPKVRKDLKAILNTAQTNANDVAVIFLDLDRFKKLTIDLVMTSEIYY